MGDEISWQVELAIDPERIEEFRASTEEMIESIKHEEGVLIYERFLDKNGGKIFIY